MAFEKGITSRSLQRVQVNIPVAADCVNQYAYVADKPMEVIGVQVIFVTKGSDGGGLTLDVVKCTGVTAVSAGTSVLGAAFNIGTSATNATLVTKSLSGGGLSTTLSARFLAAGDKLGFNITGVTTAVAGVNVKLVLRPTGAKPSIF